MPSTTSETYAAPRPRPASLWATAVGVGAGLFAVLALQLLLAWLWPDRLRVGLAMAIDPSLDREDRIPLLAHPVIVTWVWMLAAALVLRLHQDHPRALSGLRTDTASVWRIARSGWVLAAFYSAIGLISAILEHLFTFHFQITIAQYVTVATVAAGILFAGRRRPFRGASLTPPSDAAGRRRRRWANWLGVVLAILAYACWMSYERLRTVIYELDTLQVMAIDLATVPVAIVFGWAWVHSSAADGLGFVVRQLEARSERLVTRGTRGAAIEWLVQVGVVGLLLIAARWFWVVARDLWTSGRWIVKFEPDQRLLGVDWYWASVWEAVTAAEVLVLPMAALLVTLGVRRAWIDR